MRHPRRVPWGLLAVLCVAAAVAVLALASCGSKPDPVGPGGLPSALTMHGTVYQSSPGPCSDQGNRMGGTAVSVVSPSGAELGQGSLGPLTATGRQLLGLPVCRSTFTVSGLPAERMYGVRVEGVRGTTWVRAARARHPVLVLGPS